MVVNSLDADLSAILITRDEEANIGACLTCLKDLVDEIIVVDTGSTDNTRDIARSFGARVLKVSWQDDFAAARNICLDNAKGAWALYVDADERVKATGDLAPTLQNPQAIAARVEFRASSQLTPYSEYRLFRNRPDIRFQGVIHETVLPDIDALIADGTYTIADAPLAFEHLGYEGDITWKHRRNLPLLQRAVKHTPGRVYLWLTLGEALRGLDQFQEAEDAWRKGLAVLRKSPIEPADAIIFANLIDLHLSDASPQIDDILALVNEAVERFPDDPLIMWWKARYLASQLRYGEARTCLERVLTFGKKGGSQGALGYDRALFGAFSWCLMGTCHLKEGNKEEAVKWLRKAAEADPANLEYRTKLAYAAESLKNREGPI